MDGNKQTNIDRFIKSLSGAVVSDETTNLYRGKSKAALIRRENLSLYLHKMHGLLKVSQYINKCKTNIFQ